MTFMGIARNFHPTWRGWPLIDTLIAGKRSLSDSALSSTLKQNNALRLAVNDFYRPWWQRIGAQHLSQDLANIYMDFYIHKPGPAVKIMQQVLNAQFFTGLAVDGAPGPNTNSAVKQYDSKKLYNAYRNARLQYYQDQRYISPTFWQAWVNRVKNNFPAQAVSAFGGLMLLGSVSALVYYSLKT
jgi:lysozyme family protein